MDTNLPWRNKREVLQRIRTYQQIIAHDAGTAGIAELLRQIEQSFSSLLAADEISLAEFVQAERGEIERKKEEVRRTVGEIRRRAEAGDLVSNVEALHDFDGLLVYLFGGERSRHAARRSAE